MKHFLIYLTFTTFLYSSTVAQTTLLPCGTAPQKSEWLKNYQKDPQHFALRSGEILWVPLSITIVGQDSGKGYLSERVVHEALCTLNTDYSDAEIQFYIANPLRYLNNSLYFNNSNVLIGAEMMFANNLENMINIYFVGSAAGFCGYNLPYAGIAISANCVGSGDHTWAHELGHNLSLPHPFLGWEGGISHDGSIGTNYNISAPEKVQYDYTYFQDTLILDTMIIDTAYVEKMDGSNCEYAADGFCDTAPDYLYSRWQCDINNGESEQEQTDPNGVKFKSDGSLFMSYALDHCSNRFSQEQIAAMRANLIDEKSHLLGNEIVPDLVNDDEVEVTVPEKDQDIYFENVFIEWEPVENATAYSIQLALTPTYGLTVFDTIVYDNSFIIQKLKFPNKMHYFRIKGFNEYHFCSDFHAAGNFFASEDPLSIREKQLSLITIAPTVLKKGDHLTVSNPNKEDIDIVVSDIHGTIIIKKTSNAITTTMPTNELTSGIYLVSFINEKTIKTKKIIITD
ncbi:MAG: T9SS type A sorting domain-containing protein [Saprospiraceae bacterium]